MGQGVLPVCSSAATAEPDSDAAPGALTHWTEVRQRSSDTPRALRSARCHGTMGTCGRTQRRAQRTQDEQKAQSPSNSSTGTADHAGGATDS